MEQAQEKYVTVNKTERSWRPEEHFDIRHGDDAEFGVCPAGFQSYFGPVLPHYAPLWNGNFLCQCMLEVGDFHFVFTGDYS